MMEIEPALYQEIAAMIESDQSPVGIDAKKTHVMILHSLMQINARLHSLEEKLGESR